MTTLLDEVLAAHGGIARWRELSTVTVGINVWGKTWDIKEQTGLFEDVTVEAKTREQALTLHPFVDADGRGYWSGDRVHIDTAEGVVREDRANPRDAFEGRAPSAPWDHLDGLYFGGYALWNYFNLPFLAAQSGFHTEEIDGYDRGDGTTWRRLRVGYPPGIHTHNSVQDLYIDDDGLIVRHDYSADVVKAGFAAHYLYDYAEFDGFMFPTRRRVSRRGEDLHPLNDLVLIGIDVTQGYVLR